MQLPIAINASYVPTTEENIFYRDEPINKSVHTIKNPDTYGHCQTIIRLHDFHNPATLQADASMNILRAYLLQEDHTTVFASKSLTDIDVRCANTKTATYLGIHLWDI